MIEAKSAVRFQFGAHVFRFQSLAGKLNNKILAWWQFAVPAVSRLAIALITIGSQTIKVPFRNSVESLR